MFTQSLITGMPYDLFWHGDPSLFFNYLDAYERRIKEEYQKIDFTAWLHGFYIDYAFKVNHPFAKKAKKYLDKPIQAENKHSVSYQHLTDEEKEKFEEELAIAQFKQFGKYANMYNKEFFGVEDGE